MLVRVAMAGWLPVVVARWSEHWQLKPEVRLLAAFHFFCFVSNVPQFISLPTCFCTGSTAVSFLWSLGAFVDHMLPSRARQWCSILQWLYEVVARGSSHHTMLNRDDKIGSELTVISFEWLMAGGASRKTLSGIPPMESFPGGILFSSFTQFQLLGNMNSKLVDEYPSS